jgi:hypothetical protein
MTTRPALTLTTLTAATLAALATGTTVAFAGGGDRDDDREVERTGSCTGGARWELKADEDDGGIEVEGEVDSNRAGQAWAWTLRQNGAVVARGTDTTGGRSGSFDVERHVSDKAGTDRFVFKASYRGQVCRGSVSF